jgi:rod shape-determining protein MreB
MQLQHTMKLPDAMSRIYKDILHLDIAIDLGTANTLVYMRGRGIVMCEPSVVAIDKHRNKPCAVGIEAKRMLGRTPGHIVAVRPMKDGVISDFEVTQEMLRYFIDKARKMHRGFLPTRPRVVVCVPASITEVEARAVRESAEQAGAKQVETIEEPMAAAIGAGLPVADPTGHLIVDIGGGTTEVAVISLGGIVVAKSIRVAGDEMDNSIAACIKRDYNLMIGERTSEDIKVKLGSALPMKETKTMTIKGRDLIGGLPRTIEINSDEIREALAEPVSHITNAVRWALEKTPPELASDILTTGVVLAGGGSQLRGLDLLMSKETGLPTKVCENPETAIVLGTGKSLDMLDVLNHSNGKSAMLQRNQWM